jgi:hypothetical protein
MFNFIESISFFIRKHLHLFFYNKSMRSPVNIFASIKIKSILLFLLCYSIPILYTTNGFAQKGLSCSVKLIVRKGDTEGSKIVLYKNGSIVQEVQVKKGGLFEISLEYNNDFILSFEKKGYVAKKIEINTKVPDSFSKDIENNKDFDVEILMLRFFLKKMV